MKISALLVNHNSGGTILKSIRALTEQDYPLNRILVVDNGSSDGDPARIRLQFPGVEVIETHKNLGISRARNIGLQRMQDTLVLLVDDDVYLSRGCLRAMLDAYQGTNAAVICPRIVLYPEADTIQCDGAGLHFSGALSLRHTLRPLMGQPPTCTRVHGFISACLLIDRGRLGEILSFDEDYFFYFEDTEFSYRLSALGYPIFCEETAIAYHERGEGTPGLSFRGKGAYPKQRAYLTLRNRWLTILLHYQFRTLLLLLPALAVYEFSAFWDLLRRGWLVEYASAGWSILTGLKSILQRRKQWQRLRKVSDGSILLGGTLPFAEGFVDSKRMYQVRLLNRILNWYWDRIKKWL